MLRVLFTIAAFFSLLACIASLVMWPISETYISGAGFRITSEHSVGFETHRGSIIFMVSGATDDLFYFYHDDNLAGLRISLIHAMEDAALLPRTTLSQLGINALSVRLWVVAAITAMPPALWFWLVLTRPRRRRRRGACGRCGYDLRGNPGVSACPECGNLLSRPTSEQPTSESP